MMKSKRAVILAMLLFYVSLLHAMEQASPEIKSVPAVVTHEFANEWMAETYFALLAVDLQNLLKEMLLQETPEVFGCALEVNSPLTLKGHKAAVLSAEFSPTGDRVVTASQDNTAKLWNVKNGSLIATLGGHTGLVKTARFNVTGDKIVTASWDSTAKIWNGEDGSVIHTLSGHANKVSSAQFNVAGTMVVTASGDRTAKVWRVEDGSVLVTLDNHLAYGYRCPI